MMALSLVQLLQVIERCRDIRMVGGEVAKFVGAAWSCESSAPGPPLLVDANQEVFGVNTVLKPHYIEVLLRLNSGPLVVGAKPGFLWGFSGGILTFREVSFRALV